VVPGGFLRDAEPACDRRRLEPFAQETQDFLLPRGEVLQRRVLEAGGLSERHSDAEDPHDVAVAPQRSGGEAHRDPAAVPVEHHHLEDLRRLADDLACEVRPRELAVLRGHVLDERLPAQVAEQLDDRAVDPGETPFAADHEGRRRQILNRSRKIERRKVGSVHLCLHLP
jgi:hypothetical protein